MLSGNILNKIGTCSELTLKGGRVGEKEAECWKPNFDVKVSQVFLWAIVAMILFCHTVSFSLLLYISDVSLNPVGCFEFLQ